MKTEEIAQKMISYSEGNIHDINHFLKVWSYARIIGIQEKLDEHTQRILETAALVHDIACPLCREKYGNTDGKYQEQEGIPLTQSFLAECGCDRDVIDRVAYLVGHHHTYTNVSGMDHQILLEADFLVNADESSMSVPGIENMLNKVFKTQTGKSLLTNMYLKKN